MRPDLLHVVAAAFIAGSVGLVLPAHADDADILQIRQAFEPGHFEAAAGTTVTIMNADDVSHNLHLAPPSGAPVDYGVDKPGDVTKITFATPGVYTVMCSIHPRMKLKVTVR